MQIYWGVEEVHFFIHLFTLEVEPQRTAMARVVGDLGLWEIWACLVIRRMYDVFCLVGIETVELSFNYLGGNF